MLQVLGASWPNGAIVLSFTDNLMLIASDPVTEDHVTVSLKGGPETYVRVNEDEDPQTLLRRIQMAIVGKRQ